MTRSEKHKYEYEMIENKMEVLLEGKSTLTSRRTASIFSQMPSIPASQEFIEYLLFQCPRRPENKEEQYQYWIEPIIKEALSGLAYSPSKRGKDLSLSSQPEPTVNTATGQSDLTSGAAATRILDSSPNENLSLTKRFASWVRQSISGSSLITSAASAADQQALAAPPSRLALVIPEFEPVTSEDGLINHYEQDFTTAGKKLIKQLLQTQKDFNLTTEPLYGAVTCGYEWEFYCLQGKELEYLRIEDVLLHHDSDLAVLIGVLRFIAMQHYM